MNGMSVLTVERTLYQAPRFRLAEFWCPPDSPRWREPNVIPDRPHVAFPRTSTVIGHSGCEPTLANSNHVMFYNPGQRYERMLHDPDGDRCWFVELDAGLLAELTASAAFHFTAGPTDAVLAQMRRNGHWVLAKGVDFDASYRFRIDPHDFGLTVGPTVFEPSATPPDHPDATISSDAVTFTNLFNAGLTLDDAESSGRLRIGGDRTLALALLEKLTLGPWQA